MFSKHKEAARFLFVLLLLVVGLIDIRTVSASEKTLKQELLDLSSFPESLLSSPIPAVLYGRGPFHFVRTVTYLTGSNTLESMKWPEDSACAAPYIWWAIGRSSLELETFNRLANTKQTRVGDPQTYKVPGGGKDSVVSDTFAFKGAPLLAEPAMSGPQAQVHYTLVPMFGPHWVRQAQVNRTYIRHIEGHIADVLGAERDSLGVHAEAMLELFDNMLSALKIPKRTGSDEDFINQAAKSAQKAGEFKEELIRQYQWALRWDREFHERETKKAEK